MLKTIIVCSKFLSKNSCFTSKSFLWSSCKRNLHIGSFMCAINHPHWHYEARERSRNLEKDWHHDLEGWTQKNEMLYPPLSEDEGVRPAEIYYGRAKIRCSTKKLFHLTHLVRKMNIDEAIYKLDFMNQKAAKIIREVLIEAQELAVNEHNVEFKSNLHIVHSFACKHSIVHFPIYHACGHAPRKGSCHLSNYYVLLREGPAPLPKPRTTALEKALDYIKDLKSREITDGLHQPRMDFVSKLQ